MKREETPKHVAHERLEQLWPTVAEVFDKGGTFTVYPAGVSMLPLLRPGEDGVLLAPPPKDLKPYDIVLYRRKSGAFVLHRVVAVREGEYDMLGDNQIKIERGVKAEQILAIAKGRYRGGAFESFDTPAMLQYAKRRVGLRPLRSFYRRGRAKLCQIFRRGK